MEVLALIPARGGSKALPRKNVRLLAGRPLIAYSIELALAAKTITRTIISTDDQEIADVARAEGAGHDRDAAREILRSHGQGC